MEANEIESAVMFALQSIKYQWPTTLACRLLDDLCKHRTDMPDTWAAYIDKEKCPGQHLGRVLMDNLIILGKREQCKNNLIRPRLTLQCTFDYGNFLCSNILLELLRRNTFTCQGYPTCCRRLRTLASTFSSSIPNFFKQTAGAHISHFTSQFLRHKFVSFPHSISK